MEINAKKSKLNINNLNPRVDQNKVGFIQGFQRQLHKRISINIILSLTDYIPYKYLKVKKKTSNILGDNVRDYSWYQKTLFLK